MDIDIKLPDTSDNSGTAENKNDILLKYNPKNDYNLLLSCPEDFEK